MSEDLPVCTFHSSELRAHEVPRHRAGQELELVRDRPEVTPHMLLWNPCMTVLVDTEAALVNLVFTLLISTLPIFTVLDASVSVSPRFIYDTSFWLLLTLH